ncbi:MAG: hypothetical protein Q8K36_05725, partial [Alphaproteobacteria bacterium]|nr:hypothetical protein [Alphaproteobacteria bacterium]
IHNTQQILEHMKTFQTIFAHSAHPYAHFYLWYTADGRIVGSEYAFADVLEHFDPNCDLHTLVNFGNTAHLRLAIDRSGALVTTASRIAFIPGTQTNSISLIDMFSQTFTHDKTETVTKEVTKTPVTQPPKEYEIIWVNADPADLYIARVHIDVQSLNITKIIKISQGHRLNQIQIHPNGVMHYTRGGSIYEGFFPESGMLDFSQEKLILEHRSEIYGMYYDIHQENMYYADPGSTNNIFIRRQYPGILPNATANRALQQLSAYCLVLNPENSEIIYTPRTGANIYIASYNASHSNQVTDIKLLHNVGIVFDALSYNPSENALYWRLYRRGIYRGVLNHETRTLSNVQMIMPSLSRESGGIAVLHK